MKAFVLIASLFAVSTASAMTNTSKPIVPPPKKIESLVKESPANFGDGVVYQPAVVTQKAPLHVTMNMPDREVDQEQDEREVEPEDIIVPFLEDVSYQSQAVEDGTDDISFNENEEEEFDPYAPGASSQLQDFLHDIGRDALYPKYYDGTEFGEMMQDIGGGCSGISDCRLYIEVDLSNPRNQFGKLYVSGAYQGQFKVSGAGPRRVTRNWNGHPTGAFMAGRHDSSRYPSRGGRGWNGLGNMPYAMFYSGNFALHGTPSIGKLGRADSHGCVRMDPVLAGKVNKIARAAGHRQVWFYIHH